MMFPAHLAEEKERIKEELEIVLLLEFVTPSRKMEGVYPYSKFYLPTIVFMTVPTVSHEEPMTFLEPHSR